MATEHEEEKTESPLASRGFIISAGVIGLIAIMGVSVVGTILWPDQEEDTPPAAAEPSTDPEPETETAPAQGESMCGLPHTDTTQIEDAPDASWEFVGAMQAPATSEEGPGLISEETGFRQCYANSPEGALLAAANVLAMGTDPNLVQELNEELVADGPGRDAVLEDLENNGPEPDAGIRLSIEGFNLMGYSATAARIDLAVEGSNDMVASMTTDLVWEDGDWKVELGPDGQPIIPVAQLADTSGYIPWAAEG